MMEMWSYKSGSWQVCIDKDVNGVVTGFARYEPFGGQNFATNRPLGQIEAWLTMLSAKWAGAQKTECAAILAEVKKCKSPKDTKTCEQFLNKKLDMPGISAKDYDLLKE